MPAEERLDLADIQGAVIPGFKKDHAVLLALRIGDVAGCKDWLRSHAPRVARADEVLKFNRLFKAIRERSGDELETPKATWISISFSAEGLSLLRTREEIEQAFEDAFVDGMYQSALADPPLSTWVLGGGAEAVPHILVVVAADHPDDLEQVATELMAAIPMDADGAPALHLMARPQIGATLPGPLRGHEHFGFKDGISQPAIRGLASEDPLDFIDARRLATTDPNYDLLAEPGRPLVWPGQFVIGYNRQRGTDYRAPDPPLNPRAEWQRNGSYLVYRRLRQHVHQFWQFCSEGAQRLSQLTGQAIEPAAFAASLVGRWPSGAPLSRAQAADDAGLAKDDDANNDFMFSGQTPAVTLADGSTAGAGFPAAGPDPAGRICPFVAHIRKVNPRDDPTDVGGPRRTRARLMLRRGIPYGPAKDGDVLRDDGVDRGLLFMSYQTSIAEQFEFVTKAWANRRNAPHNSNPSKGQDPLIGQSSGQRFVRLPRDGDPTHDEQFILPAQAWVEMTGGGYFFTPSISALSGALTE